DASRSIVIPGSGAQIGVRKEVARNADLLRRENSPCCCRRISCVMKRDAEAKTARRDSAENLTDRAITDRTTLRTHPERCAAGMPEQPRTNDIEIKINIWF